MTPIEGAIWAQAVISTTNSSIGVKRLYSGITLLPR